MIRQTPVSVILRSEWKDRSSSTNIRAAKAGTSWESTYSVIPSQKRNAKKSTRPTAKKSQNAAQRSAGKSSVQSGVRTPRFLSRPEVFDLRNMTSVGNRRAFEGILDVPRPTASADSRKGGSWYWLPCNTEKERHHHFRRLSEYEGR